MVDYGNEQADKLLSVCARGPRARWPHVQRRRAAAVGARDLVGHSLLAARLSTQLEAAAAIGQTLEGSFSAVSKPTFASK